MAKYEARLGQDLNQIQADLGKMGQTVCVAIKDATRALLTGDVALANNTGLRDQIINRQQTKIGRLCHAFNIRHQPVSKHLRKVSSTLRLVNELERIGDYATILCHETIHMAHAPEDQIKRNLKTLLTLASNMLEQSVDAYLNENAERARATMSIADTVEKEMDRAFADLVAQGSERAGETTSDLLDIHTVYYMIERICNRAENICEETLWVVFGEAKPEKSFHILFLDEDHRFLGPMAAALARQHYPKGGFFYTASKKPVAKTDENLTRYLENKGITSHSSDPQGLSSVSSVLENINTILICVQGTFASYGLTLPLRGYYLEWGLPPPPGEVQGAALESALDDLHAQLETRLAALMKILIGSEGE